MRMSIVCVAAATLGVATGCAPRSVVPTAAHHPASADAPVGRTPPELPTLLDEEPVDHSAHHGHGGHGGHGGVGSPDAGSAPSTPEVDPKLALAEAEQAALALARPVFDKYCTKCHSSKGAKSSKAKLRHLDLDSYPFGGHHASTVGKTVRFVLGVLGEDASMPLDAPGVVKGAELDAVVAWSHAFDRAQQAGVHGTPSKHGGHH